MDSEHCLSDRVDQNECNEFRKHFINPKGFKCAQLPSLASIAGQLKADALEQMLLVTFGETKVARRAGAEARKYNKATWNLVAGKGLNL